MLPSQPVITLPSDYRTRPRRGCRLTNRDTLGARPLARAPDLRQTPTLDGKARTPGEPSSRDLGLVGAPARSRAGNCPTLLTAPRGPRTGIPCLPTAHRNRARPLARHARGTPAESPPDRLRTRRLRFPSLPAAPHRPTRGRRRVRPIPRRRAGMSSRVAGPTATPRYLRSPHLAATVSTVAIGSCALQMHHRPVLGVFRTSHVDKDQG